MMKAFFLASIAAAVAADTTCTNNDVTDNNGLCIQPTKPPATSGCDTTKQDVYQCNGSATPAGTCSQGSQKGTFCCDKAVPDAGAGQAVQSGRIIKLQSDPPEPVEGATVDLGSGRTATTDAKGQYSINVPLNTPYFMKVTKDQGYVPLVEQEWQLTGNADRGDTSLPPTELQGLLVTVLGAAYDKTKGALGVGLVLTKSCAGDEGGATIALDPPGSSKVTYFAAGLPSGSATASAAGQTTPTALIYNIDPGTGLKVKVTHPKCSVAPFPQTDLDAGTISYTGGIKVEVNGGSSFVRIFLQ